jgi:hypothetical protein
VATGCCCNNERFFKYSTRRFELSYGVDGRGIGDSGCNRKAQQAAKVAQASSDPLAVMVSLTDLRGRTGPPTTNAVLA